MFAACIEKSDDKRSSVGEQLVSQCQDRGLAGMPKESHTLWQSTVSGYNISLIEQSIHAHECVDAVSQNGVAIAGWLRIHNRLELSEKLGIDCSREKISDRQLVLKAYAHWGQNLCEYLIGDFSFIIIDEVNKSAYVCRDHMGVRPLYYYQDANRAIFATSLGAILQIDEFNFDVSEEYMVRYCSGIAADWVKTPYEELQKIPPANNAVLDLSKNTIQLSLNTYFEFDGETRLELDSQQDYIEQYHAILDDAVRCRVEDSRDYLSCELSGGLDSSTVTSIASQYITNPEENLYTYGFTTEILEEECINSVADYLGLKQVRLFEGVAKELQEVSQQSEDFKNYAGYPVNAGIATLHSVFYDEIKSTKANVLLSGFGGDEFSTIYGATARVELYKNRNWNEWFKLFKGGRITRCLRAFKWLFKYFRAGNVFETAKGLTASAHAFLNASVLHNSLLKKYRIKEQLLEKSRYDSNCLSINEFVLSDRWSPEITSRLEDCTLAAAYSGLEYRWPLLDVRLIKFFLSVPSQYKLRHGIPRYLHTKTLAHYKLLPQKIVWKDKSMGGPIQAESMHDLMLDVELFEEIASSEKFSDIIDKERFINNVDVLKSASGFSMEVFSMARGVNSVVELYDWLSKRSLK